MPYALAKVVPLDIETETDSGDYAQTLDRCLREIDWAAKAELQGKLVDGRYHGVAVGCYLEGGASGPKENARLVLESDGKVSVYVGSSSVGQGIETVFAQIAADALELPMDAIKGVFHGSTDCVDEGYGSYSSRSVVMGGSAIVKAAGQLREAIRAAAAAKLSCAPGDIEIDAGTVPGPMDGRCRSPPSPGFRRRRPMPATSAPTAMARTPRTSPSMPRPAMSSSSTTSRSRTSAASSIR